MGKAVMLNAVPPSSSFAASLSCQPLHSLQLHFITLPFISVALQSSGCLFNGLACQSLRAAWLSQFLYPRIACLRTCNRLSNNPIARNKNSASPLCFQHSSSSHSFRYTSFRAPCLTPLLHSQSARTHIVRKPFRYTSLFAANFPSLAHGCFTCFCFLSTHSKKTSLYFNKEKK